VELLDRFFTEEAGSRALFDLLNHALTWFCDDIDLDLAIRFYEQHLLGLAGFRPELFRCVGEHDRQVTLLPHTPDNDRPYGFDPEQGGALCQTCYRKYGRRPQIMALSPNGLEFLQECQRGPYSQLRSRQTVLTLHTEVERVMQHYVTYYLERSVGSGRFLRQLKRGTISSNQ
jgi:DNA repair protein RecO (recombination protein O)